MSDKAHSKEAPLLIGQNTWLPIGLVSGLMLTIVSILVYVGKLQERVATVEKVNVVYEKQLIYERAKVDARLATIESDIKILLQRSATNKN